MHSDNPLVSVIMPVYNCASFLDQAIESITKQTYTNWELLICDDMSTDDSLLIIKRYARSDKRIQYLTNSCNNGAAHAKNLLIKKSKGDFIALQDADDVCDENRIADQLDYCLTNRLDACGTNHYTVDESGNLITRHRNYESYQQVLWSAFNNFSFCNASLFIKRESILGVDGYNESLRTEAEDVDMLFRLLLSGVKIQNLDKFCYGYRQHANNVSKILYEKQRYNSFNVTRALIENVLAEKCPDDFVNFMKYYHRSDFQFTGDCLAIFNRLLRLIACVEKKILLCRINDRNVKLEIARKMVFLSLNYRHWSKVRSFVMIFRTVGYYPFVLSAILRDRFRL